MASSESPPADRADAPAILPLDPRPEPPPEPDPADCCGEGCVPCVYDRYDDERERYKAALAAWLLRHPEG